MAISRLSGQDAKAQANASSVTATYPGATTAGNLLVASAFSNLSSDTLAISGWTKAKTHIRGANVVTLFYKLADGTETTVQVTTGAGTIIRLHIYEYTGNANPIVIDISNDGEDSGTNTSWLSPSITTTYVDDLLFIAEATTAGVTGVSFDSSFNLRQVDVTTCRLFDGDRIVNATGTYSTTASWTTGSRNIGVIIAFKAAPIVGDHMVATGFFAA